ncbi:hypothetical protein BS78_03G408100 [Paspalum vaginatum]|nr:hypothetical protein BS78_03G408100 [Paspalum vaginatum]
MLILRAALALGLLAGALRAQPFDYPSATAPTTWANKDASLPHHVAYADGSVARAALLRLNPAGVGPSYAVGFFCTDPRPRSASAPCADFLLAVAVVYCNSGALMTTSVVAGVPQVVWSANRACPVAEGSAAELTAARRDRRLSFDHPTDALLVGQSLRPGARLTTNASAAWSPSRLYLAVADDGLAAYVDARPPQRYYRFGFAETAGAYATYANGSLTVLAPSSSGAPLATIQLPAVGAGTVQYMRLEYDGHLRLYEWRPAAGWAPVFDVLRVFPDDCAFPTVCGAYGVCTDMQCSCPDAASFRPVDFRRPNRGCVPKAPPASCGSGSGTATRRQRLLPFPGLAYFNDHATSLRTLDRVSDAACRKACLDDCACVAAQFIYGADARDGFWYLQSEVLSLEMSQPEAVHYNSTMYLKVQATRAPARF